MGLRITWTDLCECLDLRGARVLQPVLDGRGHDVAGPGESRQDGGNPDDALEAPLCADPVGKAVDGGGLEVAPAVGGRKGEQGRGRRLVVGFHFGAGPSMHGGQVNVSVLPMSLCELRAVHILYMSPPST